ncbi:MAG: anthranilate synthase, component I [uncultured archaeon A07HB70]|nr:MAG: anthranilate synthase, component I [uncultured archaeon A07HB70]
MTDLDLDREAFRDHAAADGPVVVRVTAPLPAVSPLAAYAALVGDADHGFLLESAEKTAGSDPDGAFQPGTDPDRHARYSFVGYDPEAVVTVTGDDRRVTDLGGSAAGLVDPTAEGDVLDALRGALPDVARANFAAGDRQRLDGGLVGFLAYDAVYDLWLDEVGVERPDPVCPDAEFVLATSVVAVDHADDDVELVLTPVVRPDDDPDETYDALAAEAARVADRLAAAGEPSPGGFVREGERAGPRDEYEAAVRRAKEHVLDGDIYQGVISRSRVLEGEMDPLGLYAALRTVNPSPYMYLLRHGDRSVVGASPETLVSVRGDRVTVNPIAGTCPRGTGPVDDRRLAGEMLADGKERAEHTMLVDLGRNDVRRVSEAGSVEVDEFMSVIKYSHVQHIESTVTGRLGPTDDAFDATRATFPAGTLTGAPKVRAMELVDALETSPRGVYGGGVGYFSWDGDADFAIVIRSATVDHATRETTVRAGAGVVADSDPASEYEETEAKMGGVLDAVDRVERTAEEATR